MPSVGKTLLTVLIALRMVAVDAVSLAEPKIPNRPETSGTRLITADTQRSIDRGLRFLSDRQSEDGSFGPGRGYGRDVGVVAIGGMAFLASGSTPGRGPYGENVNRCVDYILASTRQSGFITVANSQSHGPMYGHGFATLFLAEAYGMSPRKDVREKLDKAVRLIVASQNKEGGWRYDPEPKEADVSVTVCQIMALRAARNCGLYVPKDTVDRCIEYVKRCQNEDGGFRYQLVRKSPSMFARSAAGVVALYNSGVYEGPEVAKALSYLQQHPPRGFFVDPHYYYGHYYAVQAMYQAGGDYWERWYPAIRDQLVRDQLPDGSWSDQTFSNEYGAATALIVLQVPNNYLPIFQR